MNTQDHHVHLKAIYTLLHYIGASPLYHCIMKKLTFLYICQDSFSCLLQVFIHAWSNTFIFCFLWNRPQFYHQETCLSLIVFFFIFLFLLVLFKIIILIIKMVKFVGRLGVQKGIFMFHQANLFNPKLQLRIFYNLSNY